ncbi:MAG: LptF/LptG family permease [Phycisphaerales bacterium]|nr:LptF/LptG family permease [Phycisphaerales bacterium]
MMRFPWTIWRYTSAELWRLVLLTSAVVVVVIAFAATIKPLADGKLGAAEALRLMFIAIVPMSQYALPFAAGFGATLAYHRLAADNELAAARASGLSHLMLLAPAATAGLALALVMSLLSGQLAPRFLRSMEELVTQDAARMIVGTIERGEALVFNNWQIYADRVDRLGPDPEGGASERLLLTRVAAVEAGDSGRVKTEVTARQAMAWLDHVDADDPLKPNLLRISMRLQESWVLTDQGFMYYDKVDETFTAPGGLRDDVKFLTDDELRALPRDPDRLNVISSRRRNLAYHLARAETLSSLRSELAAQKRVRLEDSAGRAFIIRAAGLRQDGDDWVLTPTGGPQVEVEMRPVREGDGPITTMRAGDARLQADLGRDINSRDLTLRLSLSDLAVSGSDGGPATQARAREFSGLRPYMDPLPALLDQSSAALLGTARARLGGGLPGDIEGAYRDLSGRLLRLHREILARRNERWAMSASVLVMVLTGAVTAIRLRGSLPLTVYLWSFFPALLAVISVNAGQEAVRSVGAVGLVMLWGGIAALAVYAGVAYLGVRRH